MECFCVNSKGFRTVCSTHSTFVQPVQGSACIAHFWSLSLSASFGQFGLSVLAHFDCCSLSLSLYLPVQLIAHFQANPTLIPRPFALLCLLVFDVFVKGSLFTHFLISLSLSLFNLVNKGRTRAAPFRTLLLRTRLTTVTCRTVTDTPSMSPCHTVESPDAIHSLCSAVTEAVIVRLRTKTPSSFVLKGHVQYVSLRTLKQ
jgi:hypothetical protein